jgi:hypothetical protein
MLAEMVESTCPRCRPRRPCQKKTSAKSLVAESAGKTGYGPNFARPATVNGDRLQIPAKSKNERMIIGTYGTPVDDVLAAMRSAKLQTNFRTQFPRKHNDWGESLRKTHVTTYP